MIALRRAPALAAAACLALALAAAAASTGADLGVELRPAAAAPAPGAANGSGGAAPAPATRAAAAAAAAPRAGAAAPPAAAAAAPRAAAKPRAQLLAELRAEGEWKNSLVLWVLPARARAALPRFAAAWLRNYLLAQAIYLGVAGAWAYYCYFVLGDRLYAPGTIPGARAVLEQIRVAAGAMPVYSLLPACTEAAAERGWTLAYSRVADVGLPRYVLYLAAYMALVEFFVYWQHRLLHDIRLGYRLLHHIHHKYNKEHTLSPFAGLAFHPLDGVAQALPYAWCLFLVPCHFLTHELLLFATSVWTTNIHDCLHAPTPPIMGAGYHTIHHTTYRHNYGQYTTYFDRLFGTLISPEEYALLGDKDGAASAKGAGDGAVAR